MPNDRRVGALDHPERYGCKSLAVYTNTVGPYFVLDGVRESVHGSQRWTTLANIKMRGNVPVPSPGGALAHEAAPTDEDAELEAAIAASLAAQDASFAAQDVPREGEGNGPAVPLREAGQDEDAAHGGAGSGARECAICLTDAVDTLLRPCNHLVACSTCARRLARHPCPIFRRPVRSITYSDTCCA